MFLSSLSEKNCDSATENSIPNRSSTSSNCINSSYRFPVGFQSVGDDNQNVRIQLAVQKYNTSSGTPPSSRRTLISPLKHFFFKNPLRARNNDLDIGHHQVKSKNEKIFENRYEGVGNFPTVYLKKSSMLYRPIRRLKGPKVRYPELPVNRFINQTSELSTESKNSPKSVLDVLQDMSITKINSKDENDYSKGLGGDLPVNEEILCRPLFVKKSKINTVSTRDNTTQTFPQNYSNPSFIASNVTNTKVDSIDPRAELRKKLAKQNNEISASLSSSLTSTFALKRKLDKITVTNTNESGSSSSLAIKKPRIHDSLTYTGNKIENISGVNRNANDLVVRSSKSISSNKHARNGRSSEGVILSPNKDRLTTIYLDMERSTSPKAQIFQNSVGTKKACELNGSIESKNQFSPSDSANLSSMSPPTIDSNADVIKNNERVETVDSTLIAKSSETTSNLPPIINTCEMQKLRTNISKNNNFDRNIFKENQLASNPSSKIDLASTVSFSTTSADSKIVADANKAFTGISDRTSSIQFEVPWTNSTVITSCTIDSSQSFKKSSFDESKKTESYFSTSESTLPASTVTVPQFGLNCKKTISDTETSKTNGINFSASNSIISPINNSLPISKPQISLAQTLVNESTKSINLKQSPNSENQQSCLPASNTETTVAKNEFSLKIITPVSSCTTTATTSTVSTSVSHESQSLSGQNLINDESSKEGGSVFEADKIKNSCVSIQTDKNENIESIKGAITPFEALSSVALQKQSVKAPIIQDNKNSLFVTSSLTNQIYSSVDSDVKTSINESVPKSSNLTFTFESKSMSENNFILPENCSRDNEQSNQKNAFTFEQKPTMHLSFTGSNVEAKSENKTNTSFQTSEFNFGTNTTQSSNLDQGIVKSDVHAPTSFGQSTTQPPVPTQTSQASTFEVNNSVSTSKVTNSFNNESGSGIFGSPSNSIFSQSSAAIFGQNSASAASAVTAFGSKPQTTLPFGGAGFEVSTTAQPTLSFGVPNATQASISFGNSKSFSSVTTTSALGTPIAFGTTELGQPGFNLNQASPQITAFGQQLHQNKPITTTLAASDTATNIFNQNRCIAQSAQNTGFATPSNFSASSNPNMFGAKTGTVQQDIFKQDSKIQIPSFVGTSASSGFGFQNKFTFGTSNNNFQASQPKTTESSVFTFGASSSGSNSSFGFGSTGSATGSTTGTNSPGTFGFTNQNSAFKFGSNTGKGGSGFGNNTSPSTFTFSAQQTLPPTTNINNPLETKTPSSGVFSFGSNQTQSPGTAFNFGSTPSPNVFSFGSSSSASSGSTFNFGNSQSGSLFNHALPSPNFSVPGTFSIGSGSSSSQSRSRASARLRRRP